MNMQERIKKQIERIANELKKRRLKLNYSQIKFAKESGLSQSMINKFENLKADPNFSTILKYENALEKLESLSKKKVKDVMVVNIRKINVNEKISKAMEIMLENDYSQLLIEENEVIIGILHENSILKAIAKKENIYDMKVAKYLEELPIIVPENYMVSDLSFLFQNKKTKLVLVGSIVKGILGIVTRSDIYEN